MIVTFAKRRDAETAKVPGSTVAIQTLGCLQPFDGGAGFYRPHTGQARGMGYFTQPDGKKWRLGGESMTCETINSAQFGAVPQQPRPPADPFGILGASQHGPLTDWIEFCNDNHPPVMRLSTGLYPLDEPIPDLEYAACIVGTPGGFGQSQLFKRYADLSRTRGVLASQMHGLDIRDIMIQAGAAQGASGGSAVSAVLRGPVTNRGVMRLSEFYTSGGAGFNRSLHIDGMSVASNSGFRSIFLRNCHFFNSITLRMCKHVYASNVFCAGALEIIGKPADGTRLHRCDGIEWIGPIYGGLTLRHVERSTFVGFISGVTSEDTAHVAIFPQAPELVG